MKKCANGAGALQMIKRTYIDANLLIAAWRASSDAGHCALSVLDDPSRSLLVGQVFAAKYLAGAQVKAHLKA
jgi:hypothetical protein